MSIKTNEKELEKKVLEMIIDRLELEDIDVDNYDYSQSIFASEEEEGLGLDSVDALELVVGIKKEFGVVIEENNTEIFKSISTIADYIRENQTQVSGD